MTSKLLFHLSPISMPKYNRRKFIKGSSALAAVGSIHALNSPLHAMLRRDRNQLLEEHIPSIDDPIVDKLRAIVLDTARAAGSSYADVRLTHTFSRTFGGGGVGDSESMTIGVRALVGGYWGFASSPTWSTDEAARLARAAVENAKANNLGKPRTIELAPVAAVNNEHWTTPIKDDPFITSEDEIIDFLGGIYSFLSKLPNVFSPSAGAAFVKQEKAFASTANQSFTQRLYRSNGGVSFGVRKADDRSRMKGVSIDTLTPAGLGFEYLRDQPLRDEIVKRHMEAVADMELPLKPVDVGRYAVVFDAPSTANLVTSTIGYATEMDRAMGYEANAGGTSYINDPHAMIGTLKIGSPKLTVTANRDEASGAATVKWDDEGVPPGEFTIVKDGLLVDMQTNREGAGWLKEQYTRQQIPFASHGCAHAPEAIHAPLTHCSNLKMQGDSTDATFETLIANTPKGLAVKRAFADMDFQQVTGLGMGEVFEVRNGKRVAEIVGANFLFRTPELWSALTAIGGTESLRRFGIYSMKGQPEQQSVFSTTAPPIAIKELSFIDAKRKA